MTPAQTVTAALVAPCVFHALSCVHDCSIAPLQSAAVVRFMLSIRFRPLFYSRVVLHSSIGALGCQRSGTAPQRMSASSLRSRHRGRSCRQRHCRLPSRRQWTCPLDATTQIFSGAAQQTLCKCGELCARASRCDAGWNPIPEAKAAPTVHRVRCTS